MSQPAVPNPPDQPKFYRDPALVRWLGAAGVLAGGLVFAGYALGDGLTRWGRAERSVTVRGLAERDVTANLATWTISYSASATDLASAQASVDRDTREVRAFFQRLGFAERDLQPTGVNVAPFKDNGQSGFTVRQRMTLRSTDIARAQKAVRSQFDLVRHGVVIEEGSGMSFTFTRLDTIKPAMVAAATRDARASAQQFAKDSGARVGAIKKATQGYFSIAPRDGEEAGWGAGDTPYKRVRVVTTIDFYLE
ncbi:SIMPL domain-containing protein [Novosphingobium sp. 1949]|uniref:SIMPL domain-containing protein n=1 Tax=Novosphingobium organovorum TaxID=2930092 RepID=A0ABT0BEM3_9SPHN|nr:SIMPL domain-containing protein [Novosphingobium organovorum]MCJ2183241.1 SIMPL domain-containing protein [Novosphingobium organovorum]